MSLINLDTSSGSAWIDLREVTAIVCHLPNRDNFNIDLHVSSGSIFTVRDSNKKDYDGIIKQWKRGKMLDEGYTNVNVSFDEVLEVRSQ